MPKQLWRKEEFDLATLVVPGSTLLAVMCSDRRFVLSLMERLMSLEGYRNVRVYPAVLPGFAMGLSNRTDPPSHRPAFVQTMEVVKPTHVVIITHVEANGVMGCYAAHVHGVSDDTNLAKTVTGALCIRGQFEVTVTALVLVPTGEGNGYTLHELVI